VKQNEPVNTNTNARLPTTWRDAISSLIKEFRVGQGWTQEELGHRSGYDPVYINMLERGHRNPSVQALINLCQAFGVRPSAFFAEAERRLAPVGNTGNATDAL
jgi:transcriptional regulator with XRE-family HTH domain